MHDCTRQAVRGVGVGVLMDTTSMHKPLCVCVGNGLNRDSAAFFLSPREAAELSLLLRAADTQKVG